MEQLNPYIVTKDNLPSLGYDISLYPDGLIVPVCKPYQYTSTEIVGRLKYFFKKHFGEKKLKVGHAGTLDPLATGVLLVCVGKATKIAEHLQTKPKEYVAQFVFGASTPSFDREHPISQLFEYKHITKELLKKGVASMIGVQQQVPPMFSAKTVDGKRLYTLARKGEEIELKSSAIEIYQADLLDCNLRGLSKMPDFLYAPPFVLEGGVENFAVKKRGKSRIAEDDLTLIKADEIAALPSVTLRIVCSKGTYIRSIARDLGLFAGSGAFMNALCRTRIGNFSLESALTQEDLRAIL